MSVVLMFLGKTQDKASTGFCRDDTVWGGCGEARDSAESVCVCTVIYIICRLQCKMQIQCLLIRAQEKHRKLSAWLLNLFLWFIIIYFLILLQGKKYQEALDDWHELWWGYVHL